MCRVRRDVLYPFHVGFARFALEPIEDLAVDALAGRDDVRDGKLDFETGGDSSGSSDHRKVARARSDCQQYSFEGRDDALPVASAQGFTQCKLAQREEILDAKEVRERG